MPDPKTRTSFRETLEQSLVFADTCSLLHPAFHQCLHSEILPALRSAGRKLIVPLRVHEELTKHSKSQDRHLADTARKGLSILGETQQAGLLDVRGDPNDPFADNVFLTQFTKLRTTHNLCLITQDVELAKETLALRKSTAVQRMKHIHVFSVCADASLRSFRFTSGEVGPRSNKKTYTPKFKVCERVSSIAPQRLAVNSLPKSGDTVLIDGGKKIVLMDKLGEGGEATTYRSGTSVAKIYHADRITNLRVAKLERMSTSGLRFSGICWPEALVRNSEAQIVGYLMPLAKGRLLAECLFGKQRIERNFPDWNRLNLIRTGRKLLQLIELLHQENILVGDLNPNNVLVSSDSEIYLVDTDSCQIEEFPCPVGMETFLHPSLHGKDLAVTLRTYEQEMFAVVTLLFMILMPGKPPYSHQGGGEPKENVMKGLFPYPLIRGDEMDKIPPGPWNYIWSHLPRSLQAAFHRAFTKHDAGCLRDWIRLLDSYESDLREERLDPFAESLAIFPNRYRIFLKPRESLSDFARVKCSACNTDVIGRKAKLLAEREKFGHILCRPCVYQKSLKNDAAEKMICGGCGGLFAITAKEKAILRRKRRPLPTHCKDCERRRKIHKPSAAYSVSAQVPQRQPQPYATPAQAPQRQQQPYSAPTSPPHPVPSPRPRQPTSSGCLVVVLTAATFLCGLALTTITILSSFW